MNLADIIKTAIGTKSHKRTVEQLQSDLAAIDLEGLERKVTAVELRRRELLLTGSDEAIRGATEELSQANLEAEKGQALADLLTTRLIPEAIERARVENIDATAARGRAAQAKMVQLYVDLDQAAIRVTDLLVALEEQAIELRDCNQTVAVEGKRRDLKSDSPLGLLAQHLGRVVPDPGHWALAGYWPRSGADRPLGSMRELLGKPEVARKAA